jgi:ATP-binding protein involved in chromosome partitioning
MSAKMAKVNQEAVLERLRTISDPAEGRDIVTLGLVSGIVIDGAKVTLSITTSPARAAEMESVRARAEQAVKALEGVDAATVVLTAEAAGAAAAAPSRQARPQSRQPVAGAKPAVPGIGAIVAVASGKGGVGKSTVAVNLALGLQALGKTVGILDADIYGPSLPRLLGLKGRPEKLEGRTMRPLESHGLKVMSMGFLVDEGTPMIWRGPMVISALTQMLREVAWGELDILVVDMPPGTGDAQLTMAQQVPLAGTVIVSTPQDLALIDARKGLTMFRRVDVPVLGIVENMSTFICPHCGGRTDLFGHGGAREEAARLGVPFLGEVPLDISIRQRSDDGEPVIVSEPEGAPAKAFAGIAGAVLGALDAPGAGRREAPRIVIED